MNWFGWFMVACLSIFALSSIILGSIILYKLKRRNSVRATIFLKAGGQDIFWIHRKKTTDIKYNNNAYDFDEKAVRKTSFRDHIYYIEGVSAPLIIDFENMKPELSAGNLNTILEDNLLSQLFASKELQAIQLLLIIVLISGILTLGLVAYILIGGVKIAQNSSNYDYLLNITRTAIRGV